MGKASEDDASDRIKSRIQGVISKTARICLQPLDRILLLNKRKVKKKIALPGPRKLCEQAQHGISSNHKLYKSPT